MTKKELLKAIDEAVPTNARNSMGCNESWYNPYYSIGRVFNKEELDSMAEKELSNLVKLAAALSEAFY